MPTTEELLKEQQRLDALAKQLGVSSMATPTPAAKPPEKQVDQSVSSLQNITPAAKPPAQTAGVSNLQNITPAAAPPAQTTGGYKIQPGDTLSGIATRLGVPLQSLIAANPQITDPNRIYAGQNLNLPGGAIAPTTPTTPVTPTTTTTPATGQPTAPGAKPEEIGQPEEFPTDPAELAQLLGQMGADPDTTTKLLSGLLQPTIDQEEIRNEVYERYGISDLEAEFKKRPEQTFEQIYEGKYSDLGLADLRKDIDDLRAKIADAERDRDEAIGELRENPWLPQASLVGRISRVEDKAQAKISTLTNQLTLADTIYSRGKEEAENFAIRALNAFAVDREYAREELEYYINRAEADVEAQILTEGMEAEKEVFRYFPEYMKAYQPEEELLSPTEAATLGLPYGTSKSQAAQMGITPARYKEDTSGLTDYQTIMRVDKIVGQFDNEPIVKNYNTVAEGYLFTQELKQREATSADDQGLLYAFAKAMDPNSVVREGEYATVQKYSQSWAEKFGFDVQRIYSNTPFLSEEARNNMRQTIESKYKAIERQYDNLYSEYGRRVDQASGGAGGTSYITNYKQAVKGALLSSLPAEVPMLIEAGLSEGKTLQEMRDDLTTVYGKENAHVYMDTYISQRQ